MTSRWLDRWSSAASTAAFLQSSDDVLEPLLQAAPADRLAELTHRTLVLICGAHSRNYRYDSEDDSEYGNCTALQRSASLLLSRGACATAVSEVDPDKKETALANLTGKGCFSCVKYFVQQLGADVTVVFGDNSTTALHAAAGEQRGLCQ
jgi:hypothetical protein